MKITSVKEVFKDHRDDIYFVIESALGKTMTNSIADTLRLKKINKVKRTYDNWVKERTNR
jgi:hypothetical protein